MQGSNGNLYGTTYYGGSISICGNGCGKVYEIRPSGKLTTLYNFCSQTDFSDGQLPHGGVVQGTDGNLYGTVSEGASHLPDCYYDTVTCATLFQLTPQGIFTR